MNGTGDTDMATLKDVAAECGLAVSTVSRILNNRGYISDEARQKVNDAMRRLNYYPNELARSLHRNNSGMIGLIVPHIMHPFFSKLISCIEESCCRRGYRLLLFNTQSAEDKEAEFMQICSSNRVAGIIMCTGGLSVKQFKDFGIPVITIERSIEYGTASVECDNESGGRLAGELLWKKGCRKVLHFGSIDSYRMPADYRYTGFAGVCASYGMECIRIPSDAAAFQKMEYHDQIESALLRYPDADGLFANSDVIGAQILQVCRKLDISVPDRMKVISFDDTFPAVNTSPRLTTVSQPISEMAELAVRLLEDVTQGRIVPVKNVLPVRLIEREST